MKLADETKTLCIRVNAFFLSSAKSILWRHRISPQEFLSHLLKLLATGDERLYTLVIEAKEKREEKIENIRSKEDYYNIIQKTLDKKIKDKKAEIYVQECKKHT
jgi:hypothetical protein